MQSLNFYQGHLDRVSRSFAFCIAKLETPFREWVSLSYLLCRVLDTVEDSNWSDLKLKNEQFDALNCFLRALPEQLEVSAWKNRFPRSIPQTEQQLLEDSWSLFNDLHQLPQRVRESIQETVTRMTAGMRHFANRQESTGEFRLIDLADVNRYCYFVAGIVGELLSKLYLQYRPEFVAPSSFFRDAYHFGLFLQKVNLLKDQRVDERESRYLVPNREVLLASLRANAVGAVNYLTSLPVEEKGFRTFCAWSLFLGAASLPWLQKEFANDDGSKIPRQVTQELLKEIEGVCGDNDALRQSLGELLAMLPGETQTSLLPQPLGWFHSIRGNTLEARDLQDIGVC